MKVYVVYWENEWAGDCVAVEAVVSTEDVAKRATELLEAKPIGDEWHAGYTDYDLDAMPEPEV